ncbi:MAG: succinate dehydrogenase assembly factor 2 [Methyloprofundus sp.]|nr:succinate dehydrogenase assembly factor 2 [Methyloprofundus sp.]
MLEIKRLRWQCRRGVKELDDILSAYLELEYIAATAVEQRAFVALLKLEDDKLLAYFFLNNAPEVADLRGIVAKIRTTFIH